MRCFTKDEAKLFEEFTQADFTTRPRFGGTGRVSPSPASSPGLWAATSR